MKIKLTVGGKTYESKGDNTLEALKALDVPFFVKGKIILEASKGKASTSRVLNFYQLRRLKANDTYKTLLAKNLDIFLK